MITAGTGGATWPQAEAGAAVIFAAEAYTRCQKFFPPPLTLTLSPRWGERVYEERTFGKRYNKPAGGPLQIMEPARRPFSHLVTNRDRMQG
jgi:hypothetical protein